MFLVGIITWWYGRGWREQQSRMRDHLAGTAAFFSIGQLLGTFFAPFRQISAGKSSGALGNVIRSIFDNLISRVIGAIVRLFTILTGLIILTVQAVYESLIVVFWLLLPTFPIIGLILMAIGLVPRWM